MCHAFTFSFVAVLLIVRDVHVQKVDEESLMVHWTPPTGLNDRDDVIGYEVGS